MSTMRNVLVFGVCIALLAAVGMGCKGKKKPPLDTDLAGMGPGNVPPPEETSGLGQPDLDLERLLFDPYSDSGLKPIYFDYDSASLRGDGMATLRENAEKIKAVPSVIVQVAGHCDERGTQEYNLALGERRALAVREHLIQLGVSGNRLITISYGEEFPSEMGSGESAWARNRRCEFHKAQ